MKPKVCIYDTTLRDGAQGEGISFSAAGKLRLIRRLDAFGVDMIEGGFAASNPKDQALFREVRKETLAHTRIAAFGSTRRARKTAAEDPGLAALIEADTPICTIFGKCWDLHVRDVLRVSAEENLAMIRDSVAFLREHGREVVFDGEHFFDGYRASPEQARAALRAAREAGATTLVLCDTNGGTMTHEVEAITRDVVQAFPDTAIGIHVHNDADLAVANSLAAVRAGARHVQGTMNGYGERTGNANLCSIIPNLLLKMGYDASCAPHLQELREVSEFVNETANLRPNPKAPFVGASAFAHKAGMHVDGVRKNSRSFEHIEPESVGNRRRILVSELSGASNVFLKARELGFEFERESPEVRQVLAEIERLEKEGYEFEQADASFHLLIRRALRRHQPFFEPLEFRVIVEKRAADAPCVSEATVKLNVNGHEEHVVGEGEGPVDALNLALRKALRRAFPKLKDVSLTDYSVRILDPEEATAAVTRVRIESSDGERTWETVGVSDNIIEASWKALMDSVEYKLYLDAQKSGTEQPPAAG